MSKKFIIRLTTIIILILGLTPCNRAAMEDILKFKDDISTDKRNSALEELVQKCFISEEKLLVIVDEGIDEKLINNLHRSEEAAIVSIVFSKLSVDDSYSTALKNGNWFRTGKYYRDQWKSKVFLISALSAVNLQEKLEKLKYTRWWNSAGYFLIFEETIETQLASNSIIKSSGCSNAYDYLSLAWKYNILSVIFLCKEVDESLMIYSFDPFGHDSAPSPWVKARELKGRQNHPWILFKWENYNGIKNSSCTESEIFFDKTKSLNGYPILMNAYKSRPFVNINDNETSDISEYTGEDGLTVNVIWKTLNAKLIQVPLASEDKMPGWIADNGTVRGNLVDIISGKVDMGMNSLTVGRLNTATTTAYPHTTLNSCFITKDKGTIPWLIGLLYVIDNWSMIAGLTVFTIAVITFGYIDDRRYGSGFLNALRVFISSSYVLRPSIIQPKLIICFLFILPLISYSTIQGKMLSLMQNPSHYANINTEKELLQSGIKYGGPEYMKNFFISPQLIPNYRSTDNAKTCRLNLKKNEEPLACFLYCFNLLIATSWDKSLHLASEESMHYPNRYVARPEFPLIERFGEILRRMAEAGLLKQYRDNGFSEEISDDFFDNNNNPSSTDTAATISLEDFTYVFIGLGIGWLSAFIVFIIELIIGRSKKHNKIIIKNPQGISPGLTAESHQIIRRISRKVKWPNHF